MKGEYCVIREDAPNFIRAAKKVGLKLERVRPIIQPSEWVGFIVESPEGGESSIWRFIQLGREYEAEVSKKWGRDE